MNRNDLLINTTPFRVVLVAGPTTAPGFDGNVLRNVAAAIAQESTKAGMPLVLDGFNIEMRERSHAAFKLYGEDGLPVPWFQFEDSLQEPTDWFNGMSPGAAYAAFQAFVHGFMGESVLGQWVVERCNFYREQQRKLEPEQRATGVVLADIASYEDYNRVIQSYGADNVTLVEVRAAGAVDLSSNIISNLEVPKRVQVEFQNNEDDLVQAVRDAAPHLFIKIATQI